MYDATDAPEGLRIPLQDPVEPDRVRGHISIAVDVNASLFVDIGERRPTCLEKIRAIIQNIYQLKYHNPFFHVSVLQLYEDYLIAILSRVGSSSLFPQTAVVRSGGACTVAGRSLQTRSKRRGFV